MKINFFIDGFIGNELHGWVINADDLLKVESVKFYYNNDLFDCVEANKFRQDLADTFSTSGHHSFAVRLERDPSLSYSFDAQANDEGQLCVFIYGRERTEAGENEVKLYFPSENELLADGSVIELEPRYLLKTEKPLVYLDTSGSTDIEHMDGVSLIRHSLLVGTYRDVFIFGFHHLHAILSADGRFVCQELSRPEFRIEVHNQFFGDHNYAIPKFNLRKGNNYYVDYKNIKTESRKLKGPIYFGSPIEPENWGMWLLNGIHSASNFVATGQAGSYLCYAATKWQRDLLNYIGVKSDKLIVQEPLVTYHAEEVSLLQYSLVDLVLDNGALAALRAIRDRCLGQYSGTFSEKIFVSRRNITDKLNGQRRLINEEELIHTAKENGFRIVEPELLSFEEQVSVFAKAKVIVGVGGAAMFNTVFSLPDAKVISIEGTPNFIINHARMFASLGLEYGFFIGVEQRDEGRYPHNPWYIDPKLVFDRLKNMGL